MFKISTLALAGMVFYLPYSPVEAQTSAVPSFRSPTCNAFCDLLTAIGHGLPSSQRTEQLRAEALKDAAPDASDLQPITEQKKTAVNKRRKPGNRNLREHKVIASSGSDGFRIYASRDVSGFDQLQGKSISLGLNGSRSQFLARKALVDAGVKFNELPLDTDNAFDALSIGDIQALAVSGEKAYALMNRIPSRFGVHKIEVPDPRSAAMRTVEHRKSAALASADPK